MKQLLERAPKDAAFTAASVRSWFRNKRSPWFRNGLAEEITAAIQRLKTHNLLYNDLSEAGEPAAEPEDAEAQQREPKSKKSRRGRPSRHAAKTARGRKTVTVRKRALADIIQDQVADGERKRLRVGASEFV